MLNIAREYRGMEERTTTRGVFVSWDRCCDAAEKFMVDEGDDEWNDSSDDGGEEAEVSHMIPDEQAAGPPLYIGDKVTLVDATVGTYGESLNYKTMRVYAESQVLYE